MTAAALQTFGVTRALLNAKIPQVSLEGTNDVLTADYVTEIIESAAAEVCGTILSAGLPLDTIAADSASVAYRLAQSLIVDLCRVNVLLAVRGHGGRNGDAMEKLEAAAYRRLARIQANPSLLGFDAANGDWSPGGYTTVSEYNSSSDSAPVVNRRWQDYADEPERW